MQTLIEKNNKFMMTNILLVLLQSLCLFLTHMILPSQNSCPHFTDEKIEVQTKGAP